jgi:type II secretory pathway pseudopilin PulG
MNFHPKKNTTCRPHRGSSAAGFTLVEFLIAMAMFVVLGGAVLEMFAKQAPYFTRQQNLVGVNIALQNAVSQMQLDLVNAGSGYYPGAVISSWPIGVTIKNQSSANGACNTPATFTYSLSCFDKLTILTLNPNTPPSHPTGLAGAIVPFCSQMDLSPLYIQANAGQTLAQTAAEYNAGDQLLLVTSSGGGGHSTLGPNATSSTASSHGITVNTVVLSAAPVVGANFVSLAFNPLAPGASAASPYMADTLDISTVDSTNLGNYFCAQDWVMKLEPTKYTVDTSDPTNPKLMRQFGNNPADTIAEQIIGFKVGAATWIPDPTNPSDTLTYSFYAQNLPTDSPAGYGADYELVRSVRVSMIGRTNPNPDPSYTFRNTFDGGPYQVVDATVVINPRNITMNGQ